MDILLRRCVECGLCLPHCATYVGTGNEVQSPRGRLALLSHLNTQGDQDAPAAFLEAFDLCIGCRACEAVCPSGVPFSAAGTRAGTGRARIAARWWGPAGNVQGRFASAALDSVSFLTFLGKAGGFSTAALRLLGVRLAQEDGDGSGRPDGPPAGEHAPCGRLRSGSAGASGSKMPGRNKIKPRQGRSQAGHPSETGPGQSPDRLLCRLRQRGADVCRLKTLAGPPGGGRLPGRYRGRSGLLRGPGQSYRPARTGLGPAPQKPNGLRALSDR